jgi:hypothetical protein
VVHSSLPRRGDCGLAVTTSSATAMIRARSTLTTVSRHAVPYSKDVHVILFDTVIVRGVPEEREALGRVLTERVARRFPLVLSLALRPVSQNRCVVAESSILLLAILKGITGKYPTRCCKSAVVSRPYVCSAKK